MADVERTLQLLWGSTTARSGPPKRGPKPSLTVQQIVAQAIAVADAEGLGAVSMHRVAKELGVTTMGLYRYVPGKDDLLELMVDRGIGDPPQVAISDWRIGMHGWAVEQFQIYRQRPWLLEAPLNGAPMGPHNIGWMNVALESLAGTGLDEGDQLYTLLLVTNYVRGAAQLDQSLQQAELRTGVSEAERDRAYRTLMQQVVAEGRFSALADLAKSGVFAGEAEDDAFEELEFGLARILDGVQVLIDRTTNS